VGKLAKSGKTITNRGREVIFKLTRSQI